MAIKSYANRPSGSPQFIASNSGAEAANVTTEQTIGDILMIKGKDIGSAGSVDLEFLLAAVNNANAKTATIYASNDAGTVGTAIGTAALTSSPGGVVTARVRSTAINSQFALSATGAPIQLTLDLTRNVYFRLRVQKATAGDFLALAYSRAVIFPSTDALDFRVTDYQVA